MIWLALALPADAWQTSCYDAGKPCEPGPAAARVVWGASRDPAPDSVERNEHLDLAAEAMARGGLPTALWRQPWGFATYSSGAKVAGGPLDSVAPVPFAAANAVSRRSFTVPMLAELPDFAYGLGDWVDGAEGCPVAGSGTLSPSVCHDFALHMGPLNSTHFLPQSEAMWRHYHALALDRMATCGALDAALGAPWAAADLDCGLDGACPGSPAWTRADADGTEGDGIPDAVQQCELEAFALEAVGQHYLQDSWSSGHMWHRWGGPEVADLGAITPGLAVAMVSGMIHGMKAMAPAIDDPLCAPNPDVRYVDDAGAAGTCAGDLFATAWEGDAALSGQHEALMACSATSWREVAAAGPASFGPLGATSLPTRDLAGDACFGQRVTNAAMWEGLHIGAEGLFTPWVDDALVVWGLIRIVNSKVSGHFPALTSTQERDLRRDLVRVAWRARIAAKASPDGTETARNGSPWPLGDVLGIHPNEAYVDHIPPTSADPVEPWADGGAGSALVRGFPLAHADQWCEDLDRADLDVLQARCSDPSLSAAEREAACGVCTEVGQWFLRDGCDGWYDHDREPLCHALAADPDAVDYLYLKVGDGETATQAVAAWCQDPSASGRPCVEAFAIGPSYEDVECYCTGYFVCYACQTCNPGSVPVEAVAVDPDGDPLTYQWSVLDVTSSPYDLAAYVAPEDTARATFTTVFPPMTCLADYTIDGTLQVKVCDPGGKCSTATTTAATECASTLVSYGCGL